MLVKRFGFAKATAGPHKTPLLLNCETLVSSGEVMGYRVSRDILYPPSISQREIKLGDNVYLIPNARDMLRSARDFVDYTVKIREKYGYGAIFYIPGVPENLYPVLFYMGYDVFDDCHSKIECSALWGRSESCMPGPETMFSLTVAAFEEGRLREMVEGMPENKSQELLRYFDLKYWKKQELHYPAHMDSLNAVSMNSLRRPDILRWQERIRIRYRKPDYARYLLLLPCSARKPYSESRSHRHIARFVRSTMHEVILTSPLGLVPRELESFYPAKNYDIPVIGHWYEEEKSMIRGMLKDYLGRFEYEGIISYLPESMRFLEDILDGYDAEMIWNSDAEALAEKTAALRYRVKRTELLRQNMESLARFQFGVEFDFSDVKVMGRYPRVDLKRRGVRLFGYDLHRGMLTLAEASARELLELGVYGVSIDDFWPEGDVFAVGVRDADEPIRAGDEVVVHHSGELRGWGIARMSSWDMVHEERGKAVKLRGYIRDGA